MNYDSNDYVNSNSNNGNVWIYYKLIFNQDVCTRTSVIYINSRLDKQKYQTYRIARITFIMLISYKHIKK